MDPETTVRTESSNCVDPYPALVHWSEFAFRVSWVAGLVRCQI